MTAGYSSLDSEFPEEYRQNKRLLVLDSDFASALWKRVQPNLGPGEVVHILPMGFGNDGVWLPSRLNECFKFGRYEAEQAFAPHIGMLYISGKSL